MEQLKLLMDYTIFHIGVYITLGGLMVSLLAMKTFETRGIEMRLYLIAALGCFLVAGMFGGLIAGNIPYYQDFMKFTEAWIGPWFATKLARAWFCMRAEHTAFWLGIAVFLVGFCRSHDRRYRAKREAARRVG